MLALISKILVGDIKHIVIIESLVNERLTGLEMYNDCIRRRIDFQQKTLTHKHHSVHSKNELIELLKYYQINASYLNGGLLFHFEMQGEENQTGLVLSNGELIGWKEMVDLFRPINIILCDKLFITMATCYGRHLYKGVDPYQKSPYSGYISASNAIFPSEIVDEYSLLFEELIEKGNLVEAFLEMQKTKSSFYYKDSKRTFEESYKFTFDSLNNNAEYKAKFIAESRKQAEQMGQPVPDAEMSEFLFQTAMKNIYVKQKQAFDFKDCK